jgi:hypothetical protein
MYLVIYRIQKKDIEICGSQRLRLQVVLATLRREKNRLPRRARERCRDPCLPRDQLVYSARIPCWWKSISLGVSHSIIFDGIVLTTEDVQVHLSTVSRITVAWDGLAISRYYYSRLWAAHSDKRCSGQKNHLGKVSGKIDGSSHGTSIHARISFRHSK